MPLDGLRAWIGEVERKLGMRTRVFLVLATIAIGGAGAAIYLAIDTREDAVSEGEVREYVEAQGGGSAATDPKVVQLEAELNALEAKVDRLEGGGKGSDQGDAGTDGGTGSTAPGGGSEGGSLPGTGLGGEAAAKEKLQDLLDAAKKENAEAEK